MSYADERAAGNRDVERTLVPCRVGPRSGWVGRLNPNRIRREVEAVGRARERSENGTTRVLPALRRQAPSPHCIALASVALLLLCAPPAQASLESELAFHKGVVAFAEGRMDDAEQYFVQVLAEDPDDATALQYLGMIHDRQGETASSIEYFRRAALADPDDPQVRFAYGSALLKAGKAMQAGIEFEKILEADPTNAQAHLYAGIAMYRQQNYPAVVTHMEKAAELDPSLRQEARYYTGLAEVFMGDIPASTAAFGDAAGGSPTNPLSESASTLKDQIRPFRKRWGVQAIVGIQGDSNPLVIGDFLPPINAEESKPDYAGVFNVNAQYALAQEKSWELHVGYSGYFALYKNTDIVDQQTHVVWMSGSWARENVSLGLRFDYANTDLDWNTHFRDLFRLTPTVNVDWGEWGVTQFIYQFQRLDYKFVKPPPIDVDGQILEIDPTGYMHTVGANHYLYFDQPFTYGRMGIAFETTDPDGTEFEYNGFEINAGFGMLLPLRTTFDALYRYIYRDFKNPSYYPPHPERTVNVHRLSLDLAVPFLTYWEASLRGSFNFHDSNDPVYDFTRHVGGLYIKYTY